MSTLDLRQHGTALRFTVIVHPRAARNEIVGPHDTGLKVRLSAPPVDGAANEALVRLLADELGVSRSSIRIVAGATARRKVVEVEGVERDAIEAWAEKPR